jgi:hypothetical protein
MSAVKKIQQSGPRSKRTLAAGQRLKNTRKHSKRVRYARPTDGPGGPGDDTGVTTK